MRHATQEDLGRLDDLLAELRALPDLRERKRGYFSLKSAAFLHFHEDSGDFYVDVKLDGAFQRMRVTSRTEQLEFLRRVRAALPPGGSEQPPAQAGAKTPAAPRPRGP